HSPPIINNPTQPSFNPVQPSIFTPLSPQIFFLQHLIISFYPRTIIQPLKFYPTKKTTTHHLPSSFQLQT
ncbi:hypothetical protein, partial [Campylobacter canadensis]|uniref:hypothetical protein n=1 Tax=Campylobacter canadensis TaxID=449520 RepID=UPI001CCFDA94